MNYKIVNTVFKIKIINNKYIEKFFQSYETSEEEKVSVSFASTTCLTTPKSSPVFTSKFYDLFIEDTLLQTQKSLTGENGEIASIKYYSDKCDVEIKDYSRELEAVLLQYIIAYYVCRNNKALFIHSSCFSYQGNGYLLCAKSGVGKSTHARLWEEYYNVDVVNDDKNFVVFENEQLYVYGNPLSGKHHKDINVIVPLRAVVFLSQADNNAISIIDKAGKIFSLLSQIPRPNMLFDKDDWDIVFSHLLSLPFYGLKCTISKEAVDLLKGVIDNDIK